MAILIIEDYKSIRNGLKRLLSSHFHGTEILEAEDGQKGLDLVMARQDIDVVITDQKMPNLTGTDLIKQVRKLPDRKIFVIMLTGTPPPNHGADILLLKPKGGLDLPGAIKARAS
jgi:YesN/AraC family two-component response regulator